MSDYTHARQLLARVVPWPENGEGFVNIHYTVDSPTFNGWRGDAMVSLNELTHKLNYAFKSHAKDMFFCLSMQRDCKIKQINPTFSVRLALRSKDSAVLLKSFYLDIDVKEGGYASTTDAVKALNKFVTDTGMPKPSALVSSGTGGLHVYWVLMESITRAVWQPYADGLAELTEKHGLHCDRGVTVDAARILRVPGTHNHKRNPPAPVKLLMNVEENTYALTAFDRAITPKQNEFIAALPPKAPLPPSDDFNIGEAKPSELIPLMEVAAACNFVGEAVRTGGAAYDNAAWNHTNLISTFLVEQENAAHLMGNKHPTYNPAATREQFERKLNEGVGWPGCKALEGHGKCGSCPFKGKGGNPRRATMQAAIPLAPSNPLNDLPEGYRREADDRIFYVGVGNDGGDVWKPLMPYPLTDVWAQRDPWILHFATRDAHGRKQAVDMPFEATATADGIPKVLARQGLPIRSSAMKEVRDFFVSWMEKLRATKDAVVSSAPFGWAIAPNGKPEGFSYGGRVWTPTGSRAAANPDMVIARQYSPTGEIDPWRDASKMITDQKRPGLDLILASSFAAPLVGFTGQPGLLISAYSQESGIGKTTTMKVAQGVWGAPTRGLQGLDDTQNSVFGKMGMLKALPMYWDELKTDEESRKFVKLAFGLTKGHEKSRMGRDAQLRESGSWQTLVLSCSNESILDHIVRETKTTTAGLYRVFEYKVTKGVIGQIENSVAARIVAKLENNYGCAGLEYSKFLGANYDRVDTDMGKMLQEIESEVKANPEERFWCAIISTLLQGAIYANELELTEIDVDALKAHLLKILREMRGERDAQPVDMKNSLNVADVLGRYLNAMRARHTLKTDRIHVGAGKPPKNSVKILNDASKLDAIYVHLGQSPPMLRIHSAQFSEWLSDHGYSRHVFMQALHDEFGMKKVNGRLGGGTELAIMTQHLIEIDLAGTSIKQLVEDD